METIKEKLGLGHKEEHEAARTTTATTATTATERTSSLGAPATGVSSTEREAEVYGTPMSESAPMTGSTTQPLGAETVRTGMPATTTTTSETVHTRVRAPVVHEEIHETEETRIKPVVEREVIRPSIEQIIQPIQEHVVAPTQVQATSAPVQIREIPATRSAEDERRYREQAASVRDETRHAGVERREVRGEAVVQEVVKETRYQEVQPVIERIVEKPKIVEVTQPIREIQHLPPVVAPLQVNAPISIAEAGDLLKGTGVIGQGTYGEYLERDRGVGVGERVAEKMEERERKKQEAWVEEKEVMRPSGAA